MSRSVKSICFCAIMTAIICACTLISIPLPIGFFNLGDIAIIVLAVISSSPLCIISAGVGSALADIFLGFPLYAPATLIIKALIALVTLLLFSRFERINRARWLLRIIFTVIAEAIMVSGYFVYEYAVLKYYDGALASVPGNLAQAACAIVASQIILAFTNNGRVFRKSINNLK